VRACRSTNEDAGHARDVSRLITYRSDGRNVALVGHSLGGPVAMTFLVIGQTSFVTCPYSTLPLASRIRVTSSRGWNGCASRFM
jgi:pimeloyl-ACP methyl ester carboxylesterase